MTETAVLEFCQDQTQKIEELTRSLRTQNGPAEPLELSLDEAIDLFLLNVDLIRTTIRHTWRRLLAGQVSDPRAHGEKLQLALDHGTRAGSLILERVSSAQEGGLTVSRAEEARRALRDLEELRRGLADRWPSFTQQDVEEARAAHAQGECLELDEAFAQLAAVGKSEWLERVRQHKSRSTSIA